MKSAGLLAQPPHNGQKPDQEIRDWISESRANRFASWDRSGATDELRETFPTSREKRELAGTERRVGFCVPMYVNVPRLDWFKPRRALQVVDS